MDKWGKQYWIDFGERVGTTLLYGLATFFTLDASTALQFDKLYPVVVLPVILSIIKSLLMNLGGDNMPSASLAKISSLRTKEVAVHRNEHGVVDSNFLLYAFAILGVVLLVLVLIGVIGK